MGLISTSEKESELSIRRWRRSMPVLNSSKNIVMERKTE